MFFSYGNVDASELQQEIEDSVLKKFTPKLDNIRVNPEPAFEVEQYSHAYYNPLPDDENNHHVVVAWLLDLSLIHI